jgi:hypothetical protein
MQALFSNAIPLRFIVTNLAGLPKSLYEKVYCARGQAENLIKAHKPHLTSDRTSCTKATANRFHTTAYWLLLGRAALIWVTISVTRPPTTYQTGFADLAGRRAKLPMRNGAASP